MLDRVLGRDHHERRSELVGLGVDGDLAFLHALEERGLRLRARAVDLVSEHDVREDGTRLELEVPRSWLKTFTPVTSVGSRSGVNWIRRNEQSIDRAIALASIVLPTPGTSSIRMCPSAIRAASASRISGCLPCTTFSTFCSMTRKPSANLCQSSVGSRVSKRTSADRRRTILLRSTSRAEPRFLRHPAQRGGPGRAPATRRREGSGGGSGAPAAGRPARPLVRSIRRPSGAALRRLRAGLQPWDSAVAHLPSYAPWGPRILAPWDGHSCSTRRTSHSRWWLRDGP